MYIIIQVIYNTEIMYNCILCKLRLNFQILSQVLTVLVFLNSSREDSKPPFAVLIP